MESTRQKKAQRKTFPGATGKLVNAKVGSSKHGRGIRGEVKTKADKKEGVHNRVKRSNLQDSSSSNRYIGLQSLNNSVVQVHIGLVC